MCWTAGNAMRSTCAAERTRRNRSARSWAATSGLALASLMLRYQPDRQQQVQRRIGILPGCPAAGRPPVHPCELPGAAAFPADEPFWTIPFAFAPADSLAYAWLRALYAINGTTVGVNAATPANQQLMAAAGLLPLSSALVAQLNVATHRLQPDCRRAAAGSAHRAVQPPTRPVPGNALGLLTHAITDVATEGVDLVLQTPLGLGANRQVAADRLAIEVRSLCQPAFEPPVPGRRPHPDVTRRMLESHTHIAADGGELHVAARAINPDVAADRTDMNSRATRFLPAPAQCHVPADSFDLHVPLKHIRFDIATDCPEQLCSFNIRSSDIGADSRDVDIAAAGHADVQVGGSAPERVVGHDYPDAYPPMVARGIDAIDS